MHESILAYRGRRYLWVAVAVTLLAILAYWLDDPEGPANGGTVLGYTLGTIGLALVLWLAWFGVRKRRYGSTAGTVQGWLSAHVYLGVALVAVVLLHSGFQAGYNVHTAALVLTLLVVASGLYGVYVYLRYPRRLSENRGDAGQDDFYEQLADIDNRSRRVAEELGDEYEEFVSSGIARTQLGSTLWLRLRKRDESQIVLSDGAASKVVPNPGQEAALDWLADRQARESDRDVAAAIGELSALLRNKRRLLRQIREEQGIRATLELWLYVHVPLTAGLLMALFAHVLTVFLYW